MQNKMNQLNETIDQIMIIFNEEFPSQFVRSVAREKLWRQMLGQYESDIILAAAWHLVSTKQKFPPNIATIRATCARFSFGELDPPNPHESWGKIQQKIQGEKVDLTELEKIALQQTGTIFDLRKSRNPTGDRQAFMSAFKIAAEKQHRDRVTLPNVRAIVSKHVPVLAAHNPAETPRIENESVSPEQVKNYIAEITGKMSL